ncbi:Nop-domain-containing protein, partial [Atractiella rhizophila]
MANYVLFESAAGLALFKSKGHEEIGSKSKNVQDSIADFSKFSKTCQLVSFAPFKDAAHALENANDLSEAVVNEHLSSLLELNLPSDKSNVILGVADRNLGSSIKNALSIECDASDRSQELIRGIRLHAEKIIGDLSTGDVARAQLGLGHAYSRAKVKFNVNRSDNMIIQAIALLDQLDKDVNTFAMRVREWYGWHFPELVKLVPDNLQYARMVQAIADKSQLTEDNLSTLSEILDDDETRAKNVYDASRASMGTDISPVDLINILNFANRVINLYVYRKELQTYLSEKMNLVAPNLAALIGDAVGARLISHAGSLTNLSKYPASTVQILGAEKALFRALKTKGNTPKYGLIYHSTFIGRAASKNKGRVSRFLANKCSIASRIDCFTETPTTKFGEALRNQVEERLAFYESGSNPTKNAEVMSAVLKQLKEAEPEAQSEDPSSVKKGKERQKKEKQAEIQEKVPKSKKRSREEGDDDPKKKKKK